MTRVIMRFGIPDAAWEVSRVPWRLSCSFGVVREINVVDAQMQFREISETVRGIDNRQPFIKGTRLFIRYLTRILGYNSAAWVIGTLLKVSNKDGNNRTKRYVRHLLAVNKYRNEYLAALQNCNFNVAISKKNRWAELAAERSLSKVSRQSARRYLGLLSKYGHYKREFGHPATRQVSESSNKFYLFGPNAGAGPSEKYKDYTLITMKPVATEIGSFNKKILFMNSEYYNSVICKNEPLASELEKKYGAIYVSCREAKLNRPFVRSKFPIGDALASPMALGRVLYNLVAMHGRFECIIEGFDFYLEPMTYSGYYPTLNRNKKNVVSEQAVCSSLADHDALYNFLFVKEIIQNINVVDSHDFKTLMMLTGEAYLEKLSKSRDFSSLG